jgi:glycosyltransferase involved in cell wall biosynthesis
LLDARRKNADGYEQVIVYSPFVQRHYARALQALGMPLPKIAIVSPPAPLAMDATTSGKKPMILGVGRFFVGGHAKRQDLMIEAFRQLAALRPEAELHLAGSLPPENEFRAYFAELKRKAAGLNVHFHPNVSPEHLAKLYGEASLYWHMAGYGVDEATEAYRCEHFGITVVEAMSAGCIALVVNRGGPPQTVDHGATGYAFETLDELVNLSSRILALPSDDEGIMRMRAAAIDASRKYAPEHFVAEVRKLLRLSGSVGAQGGRDAAPELQERAISAAAN